MKWIERLKAKWNVDSVNKVWKILLVFALTGTSVIVLRRILKSNFEWANEKWFTYSYYWLVLPFYNLMLLIWGSVFGLGKFFVEFEKKFFNRIFSLFKSKNKG